MDRAEVRTAIERLEKAGKKVTVRAVRGELGRGSFQDITAHLRLIRSETSTPVPDDIAPGASVDGVNRSGAADWAQRQSRTMDTPAEQPCTDHRFTGLADDQVDLSELQELPDDPSEKLSILEVRYAVALAKAGNELRLRRESEAEVVRLRARISDLENKVERLRNQIRKDKPGGAPAQSRFPAGVRKNFAAGVKGRIDPCAIEVLGDVVTSVIQQTGPLSIDDLRRQIPELRRTAPSRLTTMLTKLRDQGRLRSGTGLVALP